jgi:hypothetical protein
LGPLHPVEQALTLLLAFGPFAVLAVVVVVRRRQDARQSADQRPEDRLPDDQHPADPHPEDQRDR